MPRPLRELPAWLVSVTDPTRVALAFADSVPALFDAQLRVAGVDTGPARLTRDQWTIQYEVTLTDHAGERQVLRLLGTLVPPGGRTPEENGNYWLPQLGVHVEIEPADSDLPALAVLTDPERARGLLETAIAQQSPHYGDM